MKKFWNFIRNEDGERILRLEGPIDEDNFWGDAVTPQAFRDELEAEEGDVTVWLCSPGGNVFAAAQIYTMLCNHKGKITVKIDSIAASAASVVAMAGDRVLMSPVAMLMVHDPMTIAMGNARDMEKAIDTLNEVKESIINAYQMKSGLSRKKISQLMEDETWLNAKKAVELGFADEILFTNKDEAEETKEGKEDGKEIEAVWQPYSTKAMGQRVLNWLVPSDEGAADTEKEPVNAEGDTEGVESNETEVTENICSTQMVDAVSNKNKPIDPEDKIEEEDQKTQPKEPESDGDDPVEVESEQETDVDETEEKTDKVKPPEDVQPEMPLIGMDGKTKDGAMPYELLKKQLEFLK